MEYTEKEIYILNDQGIGNDKLKIVCIEMFPNILSKLLHLNLSNNSISINGIFSLKKSFICKNVLESLDLSYNFIGRYGMVVLANELLTKLNFLHTLNIAHNNICSIGCDELSNVLPKLNKLNSINLKHNDIGSKSTLILCKTLQLRYKNYQIYNELLELNIKNTIKDTWKYTLDFTDKGGEIKYLNLERNLIGNMIEENFLDYILKIKSIEEIYLKNNFINQIDLNSFSILPNLKVLELDKNVNLYSNHAILSAI
jgi:Ran GTPase-activating protein (RanGAP) involved in mRNA processing and transport